MSGSAPVEFDFLGLENGAGAAASAGFLTRASSVQGIEDAMSKLDPYLIREVFTAGAVRAAGESCSASSPRHSPFTPAPYCCGGPTSPPPAAMETRERFPSPMPVMSPAASRSAPGSPSGAPAPLTIFYNGTVAVFDLPRHKAEAIIKWAETTNAGVRQMIEREAATVAGDGSHHNHHPQKQALLLDKLGGDIPLARRKSLQRFLEKRKERLTAVLPYPGSNSGSSCDWEVDSGREVG